MPTPAYKDAEAEKVKMKNSIAVCFIKGHGGVSKSARRGLILPT